MYTINKIKSVFNSMMIMFICVFSINPVYVAAQQNKIELQDVCVFVPNANNTYVKIPVYNISNNSSAEIGSIGNVCWQISGYNSDETNIYISDKGDGFVVYNIFSNDVICIYFNKKCNNFNKYKLYRTLPVQIVNDCIEGIDDDMSRTPSMFELSLKTCIKNHSVTIKGVEKALGTVAINNTIKDKDRRLKYVFTNGYLTSYVSISGFSQKAIECKNSPTYNKIMSNAKNKHISTDDIIQEVNFQIDCLYALNTDLAVSGMKNPYNYNFALLYFLYGNS